MSKNIVIVGAGAAGLSAAVKLYKNGFKNVIILEASERHGGRIHTDDFGKTKIDLGAQWCHGEEGNIVHDIVKDMELLAPSEMYWNNQALVSNGTIVPQNIVKKFEELYEKLVAKDPGMDESADASLGEFIINKYNKLLLEPEYQDIDRALAGQYLDWCHKFENSIEASDDWWQSSARGYLEYHECPGHPILNWRGAGYRRFLDVLMHRYPDEKNGIPLDIRYRKEVTSIKWQRSATRPAVLVRCLDDTEYEADHVIVTVSLGVLKGSPSLFTPDLPDQKVNCIKHLGFGVVDKIFLRFDQTWWLPDWNGIKLFWTAEDKEAILEKDKSESWVLDVFGFYTVDDCPDLLCGWVTGPSARIMESLSDDQVLMQCSALLQRFVANHRGPVAYKDPVAIKRSRWATERHVRGSYSLRVLDSELHEASAAGLAAPVLDEAGRSALLFAGEATSRHYYSTVHGAVESGFREAGRIVLLDAESGDERLNRNTTNNVIVVGAGIAGLSAAHTLLRTDLSRLLDSSGHQARCQVRILEAKSRAGGRINSVNFGPGYVENGAQWLHGSRNKLYKLAAHYKLLSDKTSLEGQGIYLNEEGTVVKDSVVNKVDFVIGGILEDLESFADDDQLECPHNVEDFLKTQFDKYLSNCVDDSEETKTIKRHLYDWQVRFQIIDNSCYRLSDLSAKAWGKYSFDGENSQAHINFTNGYSTVIEKLCEGLPREVLQCDKEVCSVEWSESGVKVRSADGSMVVADFVIVTVSLGVLKNNYRSWFRPSLPDKVTRAIEDIGFATINKVFLQFEEAWWGDAEGFQFVWFEEDSKCDPDEPSTWIYDMSGFDVLQPGAPNTLVGWVGAQGAVLVEDRTEQEVAEDCVALLRRVLKKPIPMPIRVHRSRWHSDPHVSGSYCHTRPICDANNTSWKDLASPILDKNGCPRILLAGEACSEQFFSTTHGAMISGVEQAEILLEYIENYKTNTKNCDI